MKVCIAEKPSVAREIAAALGAHTKRDGYFEGNGYAVTYTFGHLCTLKEPSDYKPHWKSWDLNNLPMLPDKFEIKLGSNSGVQKQFKIIRQLFNKASVVINCGDAGQEGELIQRWVLKEAGYQGEVLRLWISSLTTEAIKDGFKALKPATNYDDLYYAGFSRAIGDWLLGINATRLYTVKHGKQRQVLSVGRVQTPTLAMLVARFKAIENFQPQPYWELQTSYRDTIFAYEEGRFFKKEIGEELAEKVKKAPFEIIHISKKKSKEYAPKLFDLTGLQVYCNTKFGYSADETLKIAQNLYERKIITYPRVDTTFLPSDLYPKAPQILSQLTAYSTLVAPLLEHPLKKSSKVFNNKKVTDHHAIIPTGVQTNLQPAHLQVYNVIARRFIAVFYDDCVVATTTVIGQAAGITFKTTGKEILDKGWRVVFENPQEKPDTKALLPVFSKGEKGSHTPTFLQKETKPPKAFTEASLLRAMETAGKQVEDESLRDAMKANGIGRPSTRANIIETLFKRHYIVRRKKQLWPTETGVQLIDTIQNELLKSAELTGSWEKQLKDIETGHFGAGTFIRNMKHMVAALVYEVRSEKRANITFSPTKKTSVKAPLKRPHKTPKSLTLVRCPKCQKGTFLKGQKAYGCSRYRAGCNVVLPFYFQDKKISENQYLQLLEKGRTRVLKGFKTETGLRSGFLRLEADYRIKLVLSH